MDFNPKSEEELDAALVLPAGTYDFEVVEAEEKTSSSGNPMIELSLKVFSSDGSSRYLRDWLVASDATLPQVKIRHFCRSTGLMDLYESGSLDDVACEGACGRVKTWVEEDDRYGPQARVRDYIARSADEEASEPKDDEPVKQPAIVPDDIPF